MKRLISLLLAVLLLFVPVVEATQLSMVNVVNFTSTGDTVSQAFAKLIAEITQQIYPDLNSIRQFYIGSTAPSNPEAGMAWINTSVFPAVFNLRDSTNSSWLAMFPLSANAIPSASGATAGSIMYYNSSGAWSILTPGTAGQVLQTQGSGNNPIWAAGTINANSFNQLVIYASGNSSLTVTANNNPFSGTGTLSLSGSTSTMGANGLDVGSVATNQWYYVFVCYGSSGTCVLLSTSSTAPTLPAGYTMFTRVGAVLTNSSGYLYRTIQYGRDAYYIVDGSILGNSTPAFSISQTLGSWTSFSVSGYVPSTSKEIRITAYGNIFSPAGMIAIAPNTNYSPTLSPVFLYNSNGGGASFHSSTLIHLETTNLYIFQQLNEDSFSVYCDGWVDNL